MKKTKKVKDRKAISFLMPFAVVYTCHSSKGNWAQAVAEAGAVS